MPHRTFFWFILPTLSAMVLFIALPIVSVFIQSLFVEHEQVLIETESCGVFGCEKTQTIDQEATAKLREDQPLGRFNGFGTYVDRAHLAVEEVSEAWRTSESSREFIGQIMNLPLYRALVFTLTYTFVATPFILVLGFLIAVGVNKLPGLLKGPMIFFSLLPMIVNPLIGSLILAWMADGDGIFGATLQYLFNDPSLSLKASSGLTWIMLIVYGIWHLLPFSFIVFYAGLQTIPSDQLEAAVIDGAGRWQRTRHVIIPHLAPLTVFVTLILLMDNFRVLEPIIGFSAQAHAQSLSWVIMNDLSESGAPRFGAAGATSILTIIGVAVLLTPMVIRAWRDFNRKVV